MVNIPVSLFSDTLTIFIKLSIPTNFLNKFVSNPEKSKKLKTKEVSPGITLKVKKINSAGSK